MSLTLQKLTGQVWTQVATLVTPEYCVDSAFHSGRWDPKVGHYEWATKIPAVHIRRIDAAAPTIDPQTGSFLPREVINYWQYRVGSVHAHREAVIRVECEYFGPSGYHKSNQGRYTLTLYIEHADGSFPDMPLGAYDVELYLDTIESGQRRPCRILAQSGRLDHVRSGFQNSGREYSFEFAGSSFPERNLHLKPSPAKQTTLHGSEEPALVHIIDVVGSPMTPVRRRMKRPNLGIPKD